MRWRSTSVHHPDAADAQRPAVGDDARARRVRRLLAVRPAKRRHPGGDARADEGSGHRLHPVRLQHPRLRPGAHRHRALHRLCLSGRDAGRLRARDLRRHSRPDRLPDHAKRAQTLWPRRRCLPRPVAQGLLNAESARQDRVRHRRRLRHRPRHRQGAEQGGHETGDRRHQAGPSRRSRGGTGRRRTCWR